MLKNIIFDIGEVLLSYRWKAMLMEDYGMEESEAVRIGTEMFDANIWEHGLDLGRLSIAEAVEEFKQTFPKDSEVITWALEHCELMPVPRKQVWEQMKILKELGYRLYLLSNYSEELLAIHTKDAPFPALVDGAVISSKVHMLKPDEKIYRELLNQYQLKPEECIFFDDRKENVEGAQKVGISAVQILSEEMIRAELDKIIEKGSIR